ncbi:MAG: tRNA (adenosine(37)-N6)-threonylcarbamoyltransferase complex ATPase subunit type 1 TsaE [Ignavibacteriales bacterium]|nr:MAG: tRNA (adenosine(37)-N6)-threonylcarbamoyltransferase complex ATPase subunit type 1 TsaE [Ignavibacteriales bacterium]
MNLPLKKIITAESETIQLAKEFAGIIQQGDVIVLNGNLGTGKTFFIKHVLMTFGINNVNSPTFAIVNEYRNSKTFFHFDFYRIEKREELLDIGYYDYLNDSESLTFIEWGNLFNELLPAKKYEINIEMSENGQREFTIVKYE